MHHFVRIINVDHFFDRSAQVRKIFYISAVSEHGAFSADTARDNHALRVQSLANFHYESLFLITKHYDLVVTSHALEENTQSGALHDFKTDAKFVFGVHKGS